MNIKLTDILIKHNDIESIDGGVVVYKDGTTIPLSKPEVNELITAFAIHGIGLTIPVRA
jgi:hypothetical protein